MTSRLRFRKWLRSDQAVTQISQDSHQGPQRLQAASLTDVKADSPKTQRPHPSTCRKAIGRFKSHLICLSVSGQFNGIAQRPEISNSYTNTSSTAFAWPLPDNKCSGVWPVPAYCLTSTLSSTGLIHRQHDHATAMQPSVSRRSERLVSNRNGKMNYPFSINADARMILEVIGSAVAIYATLLLVALSGE